MTNAEPEDWEVTQVSLMDCVVHRWAGPCPLWPPNHGNGGKEKGSLSLRGTAFGPVLHTYQRKDDGMALNITSCKLVFGGEARSFYWKGTDPVTCPYCLRTR